MHPSELKNQALVAAAIAERDGFTATAEAFRLMAIACAMDAGELLKSMAPSDRKEMQLQASYSFSNLQITS